MFLVTSLLLRIRSLWQQWKNYFQTINLFPSVPPTTDEYEHKNQKVSTRLYIILLTITSTILLLYISIVTVTKTFIVKTPSLDQYLYLYATHPNTLTCSCTQISINYDKLVDVQYSFHQVCTSDFVTDAWINYLALSYTDLHVSYNDFRWTGTYTFQALRAFCALMNETISDNLKHFYASAYISASVIPLELLQSQVKVSMNQFILSTRDRFLMSLSLIRDTTQTNALYSATRTNYRLYIPGATNIFISAWPRFYSSCFCGATSTCSYQSAIYDYPSTEVKFLVSGLYVGCYVIDSLLQSTLQCFYNQTCINTLQQYCSSPVKISVTALNLSLSSQYNEKSTIQELMNSLMVEEWNSSITYNDYYDECQPSECIYTDTTRNDKIYIVTTVIGLIGGLITILKLIAPALVKLTRKMVNPPPRQNIENVEFQQVGDLLPKLKQYILTFNLFPSVPPTNDEYKIRNQKISTRLYIILLTITLTILLLYTSLITVTKTFIVKTPSLDQYLQLYATYPNTLTCPCTQISINYDKLVDVQYSFHQVCTSDFVTDEWVNYLDASFTQTLVWFDDFRWMSTPAFQTLQVFCAHMNKTISGGLDSFYTSTYVSASVIPLELFESQVKVSVDQFILSTTNSFLLSLSLIRDTTQGNALYSAQLTNYKMYVPDAMGPVVSRPRAYQGCQCLASSTCSEESAIYDYPSDTPNFFVPNFYLGCYVIDSLLQSTLECFYNQTCINILQSTFTSPISMNVTALDSSLPSQYNEKSTIQELMNSLMVEEWSSSITYNDYYDECQPSECIYTDTTRNDKIYIVTTVIGLIGGLMTVLKTFIPVLVEFIRKKIKPPTLNIDVSHQRQIHDLLPKLKQYILTFNLFPSIPPTNDEYKIRNQKISTRLYIILLTITLTILLLYTSLVTVTKTFIVKTPSLDQYLHLYGTYPNTLTCPCTQISINYNEFVEIQYSFHQICTSDFVTDAWINYLVLSFTYNNMNHDDFRWTGPYTFQALRAFCVLMNKTISDGLDSFYTSTYVSASVIPLELLQSQVKASGNQFILSTTNSFLLFLSLIRDTTQANTLLAGIQTNYDLNIPDSSKNVSSWPRSFSNCSCASSPTCIKESAIYDYPNTPAQFNIFGFYTGCYVIDSLLQSNLQFFYNQTCINTLKFYCLPYVQMNVTALDSSLSSRFHKNSTIQELVNSLMVENWTSSVKYKSYYDKCQPAQCIYKDATRNEKVYIVTTVIGLIGGLMTILKLVIPTSIKFFAYYIFKRRRVAPSISNM